MWSFKCGPRHSQWQGQPWSMLPEGYFESFKAIHIFPVLSRWVESEWKILLSGSEFALSYQCNIFLSKVNSYIIVIAPYHHFISDVGKFRCILVIACCLVALWESGVAQPGMGLAPLQSRVQIRTGTWLGGHQPLPGSAWQELGECWQCALGSGAEGETRREAVVYENSAGSGNCQPFPCPRCNSVCRGSA